MKCMICQSDSISEQLVKEEVSRGNDIILIKVKAMVCNSCGERYFSRKSMQELQSARTEVERNTKNLTEVGKVLEYRLG